MNKIHAKVALIASLFLLAESSLAISGLGTSARVQRKSIFEQSILVVPAEGKAEGSVTVNNEPVSLSSAYAQKQEMRDKEYNSFEGIKLFLTGSPAADRYLLSEFDSDMFYFSSFDGPSLRLSIDAKGKIINLLPNHKTLMQVDQGMESISGSEAGTIKNFSIKENRVAGKIEGKHKTKKGTEWSYSLSFDAPLKYDTIVSDDSEDRFIGRLVIDGKIVKLKHAYAHTKKSANPLMKKPDVVIMLADQPLPEDPFERDVAIPKLVREGKLHVVEIEIIAESRDDDTGGRTYHVDSMLFYNTTPDGLIEDSDEEKGYQEYEVLKPFVDNDQKIEGLAASFMLTGEDDDDAPHKWHYFARFRARVDDAVLKGKPLPAGGGAPGKAYASISPGGKISGVINGDKAMLIKHEPGSVIYTTLMMFKDGRWQAGRARLDLVPHSIPTTKPRAKSPKRRT